MDLSQKKLDEIQSFLVNRYTVLSSMRQEFDDDITEEIDLYNNIDKNINEKEDWESKYTVPMIYSIVQTVVARLIQTLFGEQNFLKIYVEDKRFKDVEETLIAWMQEELDRIRMRYRSRDYLEDSLVKRVGWIQLRPVFKGKKISAIDFDVIDFFDMYFDTTVKSIDDTDVFIRKIVNAYKLKQTPDVYFNLDKVWEMQQIPQEIIETKGEEYEAKHGISYYSRDNSSAIAEVELLEWYGLYNISEDPEEPDYRDMIFTIANKTVLIRVEENPLKTKKKKLIFPIRPLKQPNSLIGKGIPQLLKDMQYELNEVRSLRMQNFKLAIGLLFKYKKGSGIDLKELFADAGNAIGYDESPNDVTTFEIPNLITAATMVAGDIIQDMQQTIGSVDFVLGSRMTRSATETATEVRAMNEQAMFKFSIMASNVSDDILDLINYLIILLITYKKEDVLIKYPELKSFVDIPIDDLENGYVFDLNLKDLAQRRDVERTQFINAIGVLTPLLQAVGGDIKPMVQELMTRLGMENTEKILKSIDTTGQQNALQQVLRQMQAGGGGNAPAPKQSTPEEEVNEQNATR